jgi:VanZ family protein
MAIPGNAFPKLPQFIDLLQPDKILHQVVFAVYVFLQLKGFRQQDVYPDIRKHSVLLVLLIGLFLSAGTELMQEWVIPQRLGSVWDFTANVAGCLLGWFLAWKLQIKG